MSWSFYTSNGQRKATVTPGAGTLIEFTTITSDVSVGTGTYNSGTTNVIAGTARDYLAVPYLIEFFAAEVLFDQVTIGLYDGTTHVANLFRGVAKGAAGEASGVLGRIRITPTAASHTYNIKAYATTSSGTIVAGTGGGSDAFAPAYLRITQDTTT